MKIKTLIFPIFLAVSVLILVMHAKPEYDKMKNTRAEIAVKQEKLSNVKSKQGNIKNLSENLRQNQEKVTFIESFFPEKRGEEEVINGLHFIGSNTGVAISNITVSKIQPQNLQSAPASAEDAGSKVIFNKRKKEAIQTLSPIVPISAEALNCKIGVIGSYDGLVSFIEQIYRLEMSNKINGFSLAKAEIRKEKEGSAAEFPTDMLMLQMDLNFNYMPKIKIGQNYDSPLFSRSQFDFSVYEKLSALVRKNIPALDAGTTSRANPFLP